MTMATVIRTTDQNPGTSSVAFNFDDMAAQAKSHLDGVRAEAIKIVAKAQQEAAEIRRRAELDGRQAALQAVEDVVQKQLATVLPALRQAIEDIHHAKQAWLTHWETSGVHVAAAIAKRLVRGELTRQPEIPVTLVREALELAAGSSQIRVHLHPDDHKALEGHVRMLVQEMSGLGTAEIIADEGVSRGGCRVETRFGTIDQQFEAQLDRIEEELTERTVQRSEKT
jgi:flagellar assembly protein FliH